MSNGNVHQKAKPQTIETPSFMLDSATLGKKDCLHILHVDDDPCLLEVSKQILSIANNFEVDGALSVDEAFKKMGKQAYDAVVSDYEMPMKNGLQFLMELREKKNDVPFILFTGKGREEVVIQALNLGADRYINKNGPTETVYAELTHAIVSSVEKAKAKRQMFYDAMLFQNVTEPILATDDKRIIKAWNKAAENLFGWTAEEVTERSVQEVFDSVQVEPPEKLILEELDSRGVFHGEIVRKNKAGVPLDIELSVVSLHDGHGKLIGNVAVYHDISQRKKIEATLKESEEKFRSLAEESPNMIFIYRQGRVIYANKKCEEDMGYTKEEFYSPAFNFFSLCAPEYAQTMRSSYFRHMSGEDVFPYEYAVITRNGQKIDVILTSKLIEYEGEKAILGIVTDITERKITEEILRKSETRYRELANFLPEIVFETDMNGQLVFANERAAEISGYSLSEIEKGLNILQFVAPEDRERGTKVIQRLLTGGSCVPGEYTFVRKDGTTFPALITATPRISENKVTGLRGVVIDITERKKIEEAIRLSEEKYRSLFENASDVILTGDLSGKIISINGAIEKYGFQKEQVVGRDVREFLSIKDVARQDKVFQEVGLGKSLSGELEAPASLGKRTLEVKTDPLRIGDGVVGFQTILRDITERKLAEEKLRESEEKYRDIFENARDAIFVHNLKGKIISINKVVEEYGFTRDQIIGKNILKFVPKKYWPKLIAQFSKAS